MTENKRSFVKAKETSKGIRVKWRVGNDHEFENITFQNYFYMKKEDFENDYIQNVLMNYCDKATTYKTSRGELFVKLYLKDNFKRNELRYKLQDQITLYEADITTPKRWLLTTEDFDLHFEELRVLHIDIETDDRQPWEKELDGTVIAGTKQIMSIAMADNSGNEWFFINADVDDQTLTGEKDLLKKSFEIFEKYDILTGWNSKRFDFPFLQQRQETCGMQWDFSWHFINKFDEMEKYKKNAWRKTLKFSLNNIAMLELSDKKLDFSNEISGGKGRFYKLWKEQPELLKKYNLKDVQLLRELENKLQLYDIHRTIGKIARCPIEDTMYNSHTCDYMTLHIYSKKNLIAKSKPTPLEKEKLEFVKISGGYTFCFERGFFKDVEVFDYKSEYPLIMNTFNISNEVFVKSEPVDFDEMLEFMTYKEIDYMRFAAQCSVDFVEGGEFKRGKANKVLKLYEEEHKLDFTLEDCMWKFIDKYVGRKYEKYAKMNDLIYTPADFNNDTHGWNFHPHRFFDRTEDGAFREIQKFVLQERDVAKYKLWEKSKVNPNFKNTTEGKRLNIYQYAVKTVGNSLYGFTGFKTSRFFEFHIADAITTCGRFQMKKSVIFARKMNYIVTNGDTDSTFNKSTDKVVGNIHDLNVAFYEYNDEMFRPYNTNLEQKVYKPLSGQQIKENKIYKERVAEITHSIETTRWSEEIKKSKIQKEIEKLTLKKHVPLEEIKPYYCVFEHEKTFKSIIIVAKKRYYFLTNYGDVETQGGAFKKRDTNPLAAKLQKELVTDILKEEYNNKTWVTKLVEWKKTTFGYKLDVEFLAFVKGYTKHHSEFGGPMLDKKTGKQKTTKDGKLRFKSVPGHIKLIRRLDEEGKLDIEIGDAIQYIVGKPRLCNVRILREKAARKRWGPHRIDELQSFILSTFTDNEVVSKPDFISHQKIADSLNIKISYDYESTQRAITIDEFKEGEPYDTYKYWDSIISPILEILNVTDKEAVFRDYLHCWNYTERQLEKIIKCVEEDAEND